MRFRAAPSMVIVKREEKEAKLREFILGSRTWCEAAEQGGQSDLTSTWSAVARSSESPLLKALAAIAEDIGPLNIRLITAVCDDAALSLAGSLDSIARSHRHLSDPRHLNAHEQLILGPNCSWIGDCMRREPAKRDAYEQFAPDCALTAKWASMAFERLWSAADVKRIETVRLPEMPPATEAAVAAALGQAGELPVTTTASTRH
jgi:hypothetical protein